MRNLIYILTLLSFLTAGFCAVSCSQNEADRAAPNLHLVREHRAMDDGPHDAAWAPARAREEHAVAEYDAAIGRDEAAFVAAKKELAAAAAAVQALVPAPTTQEAGKQEGGAP